MALVLYPSGFATSGPSLATREFMGSSPFIWVDSVTGSDSNAGTMRGLPKATVFGASGAISVCTDLNANVIVCESTHRETIGSAYTWSIGGVQLVSLGSGSDRATFTSNVAGVAITLDDAAIKIENCYFAAATAATTATIRLSSNAIGFDIRDCQFDMGANNAADGVLYNATANAVGKMSGCSFRVTGVATGTAQVGVRLTGASAGQLIEDCSFDGSTKGFTEAAIDIDDATADRFCIRGLIIQNHSIVKLATGIEGWMSIRTKDATSRIEWTE